MNRLVQFLSRLLDPAEREAVCGDLAESGASGPRASRDLLGLIVRRQAALWTDWRPWLALIALAAPLAVLLNMVSRQWASMNATYFWLYGNNWDNWYIENPVFRHDLIQYALGVLVQYCMLFGCSWTAGFALAAVAPRAIWINGAIFCAILLLAAFPHREPGPVIFSMLFYRVIYPLLSRILLVLLPAIWGMRLALQRPALPPKMKPLFILAAITTMAALAVAARPLPLWFFIYRVVPRGWWHYFSQLQEPLLTLAMIWPLAYFAATVLARRRRVASH